VQCFHGHLHFNTQLLIPILLADAEDPKSHHDFGKDILPRIITKHHVFAYNFVDENSKTSNYWRDVGTVDAYYEANMDLVSVSPVFNLYDEAWPLRTWQHQYPPRNLCSAIRTAWVSRWIRLWAVVR